MTKSTKSLASRTAVKPTRGRKLNEVLTSLVAIASRHGITHEEARAELEGLKTARLCDFTRIPDNPHTKFKVETFARTEPPRSSASALQSSAFAKWVEAKYGGKRAG
ncbi:MAG: hypothetical protein H0T92_14380 [Pyrinomonadaceae bacterium]|nr:hypothetical protein [Pyrinomonadaceae bacterium]